MKSFAEWLDDNVASTREALAKKQPEPVAKQVVIEQSVPNAAAAPAGWVDDDPLRSAPRIAVITAHIVPALAGPFHKGCYIRLVDPAQACTAFARQGALARVLGYRPAMSGRSVVAIEWSNDHNRCGADHGFYYADGFVPVY